LNEILNQAGFAFLSSPEAGDTGKYTLKSNELSDINYIKNPESDLK
jgi:hypothetical protein